MGGDVLALLVAVTSAVAVIFGVTVLRLPGQGLGHALIVTLEVLGASSAFFILNIAVGMAVAMVMRTEGTFVPLYAMGDVVLLLFSALQGVVFALWRRRPGKP